MNRASLGYKCGNLLKHSNRSQIVKNQYNSYSGNQTVMKKMRCEMLRRFESYLRHYSINRLLRDHYMEGLSVMRMWITNKNNREITASMSESMVCFLSIAIENGCIGSTFAEDDERIIVYTRWSDEMTLEQFRSSKDYHTQERKIIQSFTSAGFEIPEDILFNSTARILYSNRLESIQ